MPVFLFRRFKLIRTEIINPQSTNYVVITAFIGGKYVSSVYQLTEDGEFQNFIAKEKYAYTEQRAQKNHDDLVALYTDKERIKHNCDFCGKPYAVKCEFLTRKHNYIAARLGKPKPKDVYLCPTCYQVHVNER